MKRIQVALTLVALGATTTAAAQGPWESWLACPTGTTPTGSPPNPAVFRPVAQGAPPPMFQGSCVEADGVRLHGPVAAWYSDGSIRERGTYDHGVMVGAWRVWWPTGGVMAETTYGPDGRATGTTRQWLPDGTEMGLAASMDNAGGVTAPAFMIAGEPAGPIDSADVELDQRPGPTHGWPALRSRYSGTPPIPPDLGEEIWREHTAVAVETCTYRSDTVIAEERVTRVILSADFVDEAIAVRTGRRGVVGSALALQGDAEAMYASLVSRLMDAGWAAPMDEGRPGMLRMNLAWPADRSQAWVSLTAVQPGVLQVSLVVAEDASAVCPRYPPLEALREYQQWTTSLHVAAELLRRAGSQSQDGTAALPDAALAQRATELQADWAAAFHRWRNAGASPEQLFEFARRGFRLAPAEVDLGQVLAAGKSVASGGLLPDEVAVIEQQLAYSHASCRQVFHSLAKVNALTGLPAGAAPQFARSLSTDPGFPTYSGGHGASVTIGGDGFVQAVLPLVAFAGGTAAQRVVVAEYWGCVSATLRSALQLPPSGAVRTATMTVPAEP